MTVVRMTRVAVDVSLDGWKAALTGLAAVEDGAIRTQKRLEGNRDTLLKLTAGFFLLTSASIIAGVYMSAFGAAVGYIVDVALTPFTPIMDAVIDGLHAFGDWLDQRTPFVKAAFLGIALTAALMWLGVAGPAALATGLLVAFGLWFSTKAPGVQLALTALTLGFGIFWAVATGGILPLLVGLGLLAVMAVQHWDKIKETFRVAIDAIMGWLQPLVDAIVLVVGNLGRIGGSVGGAVSAGAGIVGLASGGLVTRPTLALVGEAGPELVIPTHRLGDRGAGDIFNDQSLGPITVVAGKGGTAAGRDAALSLQAHLALRRRV